MKDVYAGRVTKFHSLPLTMHWLTSSSTKCVNQRSWFYFRLMICSVLVPVKTKPTDRSFVITTDPEKPLLKLVGKTYLLFCLWGYKAEGSPTEDLKSLSKCIAQPGTNLLPPLLILEIMCTYAFREKKKRGLWLTAVSLPFVCWKNAADISGVTVVKSEHTQVVNQSLATQWKCTKA